MSRDEMKADREETKKELEKKGREKRKKEGCMFNFIFVLLYLYS